MPKKPTETFGFISFAKSGKVKKTMRTLSSEKRIQECEVAEIFVAGYNKAFPDQTIHDCKPLPENDQDFVLVTPDGKVELQVTELVSRSYTFEMTMEEYDRGEWTAATQKEYGGIPWRIDTEKRDGALTALIAKKQQKQYAKSQERDLWLLVFTTDVGYFVEVHSQGARQMSPALEFACKFLEKKNSNLFDKIWFTNLQTRPVLVWSAT